MSHCTITMDTAQQARGLKYRRQHHQWTARRVATHYWDSTGCKGTLRTAYDVRKERESQSELEIRGSFPRQRVRAGSAEEEGFVEWLAGVALEGPSTLKLTRPTSPLPNPQCNVGRSYGLFTRT
ncbi:unnamed protein product [Boreogadus saida]